MRYIMLIYETPADFAIGRQANPEPYVAAWRRYHQALLKADVYISGAPLKDPGNATTVQMRDGQRHVQDGPFAESKDQLGGFMILECESLDEALDWAARCPAASTGAVEVRPMDVVMHDTIANP
ncbi:MAG TPA: YciI family protein [Gemmatimonadales bacterium]|nr:YciI family protein [Gemmatimonadales bacterium]